jgi:hypothetical protein
LRCSARQPEHEPGPELLVDAEQLEVAPERAMIAPVDLLEALQVRIELWLGRPDGPVDALQLGVVLVAAPVRASDGHELERADLSGALEVRPAAQIDEAAVRVHADLPVLDRFVELLDLVHLVVLMLVAEEPEGLRDVHLAPLERHVFLHHRLHALLDLREVVRLERARKVEVVVEAVGHRRAEAEPRVGKELEDRAGHHVRGRVAQRVEVVGSVVSLAAHSLLWLRHLSPPM